MQQIDCADGSTIGDPIAADAPGARELSYAVEGAHQTYVWKTDGAWAGSCRNLVLGLDDATNREVRFGLR
ncbi:MAG: PxKF domain-containing protein [Actinomycetota bacterium]|nr:PxKF domain-containing protein [Actinomycetota bacterium]